MNNFIRELIIVPGHAAFKKDVTLPLKSDYYQDEFWALQEFQKGEPRYYIEHIKSALALADAISIIIFSGGRTRKEAGPIWSEARTYAEIAKTMATESVVGMELEEYARDSFQNLDLSVKKFEKLFGYKPSMIYVVGWKFKEKRFRLHARTLGIHNKDFRYIGVNNPAEEALAAAVSGEAKTIQAFIENPRGDEGALLEKRLQRDPWNDDKSTAY